MSLIGIQYRIKGTHEDRVCTINADHLWAYNAYLIPECDYVWYYGTRAESK